MIVSREGLPVLWAVFGLFVMLPFNADAACSPKVLPTKFGETTRLQRSVGEIAEISCDVVTKSPSDTLNWIKDGRILTQDTSVDRTQPPGIYKVSLQDDIYTLKFKVEASDVGVYKCSCGQGSIALQLFVALPIVDVNIVASCSNASARTYKTLSSRPAASNMITCYTNDIVNVSVSAEGRCTYPGPNRKFKWYWSLGWIENRTTTVATKPQPCFSTKGINYRYKNVRTLYKAGKKCRSRGNFTLYLDDAAGFTKCLTVKCIECERVWFDNPSAIVMIVGGAVNLISIIVLCTVITRLVRKSNTHHGCECVSVVLIVIFQVLLLASLITIPSMQASNLLPSKLPEQCPKGVEFWVIALVIVFALCGFSIIVGALGSRKIAKCLQDPIARYNRHQRPPPRRPRARSYSGSTVGITTVDTGAMEVNPQLGPGLASGQRRASRTSGQFTPNFLSLNVLGVLNEGEDSENLQRNHRLDQCEDGFPPPPPQNHEPMPGKLCIVCSEEPVQVCFPACGHTNTCYCCALRLALDQPICPLCRKPVKNFSVVYT